MTGVRPISSFLDGVGSITGGDADGYADVNVRPSRAESEVVSQYSKKHIKNSKVGTKISGGLLDDTHMQEYMDDDDVESMELDDELDELGLHLDIDETV